MGGLLYKDFVSVRGKRFVCFLCIFALIFILIRVMFPGDRFLDDFMAIAEDGSRINLIDIILDMFAWIFIFMNMLFINRWTMEICGSDENNKLRSFFAAMPYEKKMIVVTDKDVSRLYEHPSLSPALKKNMYCVPLKVRFLFNGGAAFDKLILDYVAKNL